MLALVGRTSAVHLALFAHGDEASQHNPTVPTRDPKWNGMPGGSVLLDACPRLESFLDLASVSMLIIVLKSRNCSIGKHHGFLNTSIDLFNTKLAVVKCTLRTAVVPFLIDLLIRTSQ
jgi:hypothetical protein